MKLRKFFAAFVFLSAFALSVSAQNYAYSNELTGFEFFKSGRLSHLKLLLSTSDDVKDMFGENCRNGCDYDEDWKIGFAYVNSGWYKKFTENGKEVIYKPKAEFVGKLADIDFRPKKPILLPESYSFATEFKCLNGTSSGNGLKYNSRVCIDEQRIIYIISNETTQDGKVIKNQLMSISYLPTKKDDDEIFALVNQ